MERDSPLPHHVHRHVTAARAFHTDLIAHAQRRLRLLMNLAKYLNVLRSHNSTLPEKLSAAELSRKHLETLEQLRRSSSETYSDFRNAISRIHYHLNRLTTKKLRRSGEELGIQTAQRVEQAAYAGRTTSDRTARSSSRDQSSPRESGNASTRRDRSASSGSG
jgi:hypothetical protein